MTTDEQYMTRCFNLALNGAGRVSPNPLVGAVLVCRDRIIGEGFHEQYGKAHAEVNAVRSVLPSDRHLIRESTLYVSLEPCCIYGKTPPCTNLILDQKIPKVVVSCLDQTPGVAGKGIEILRKAGVTVITGILESEGEALVLPRNIFVQKHRPYIILKFAQTRNGLFCPADRSPFWITNPYSKRLVHKWRSEVDAIMVGTQTALSDNPELTNRLYFGASPLRIVWDRKLILPPDLHLFDGSCPTLLLTASPEAAPRRNLDVIVLDFQTNIWDNLLGQLYQRQVSTLLVEGGARLIQDLIDRGLWDEARIFTGNQALDNGIAAPVIQGMPVARHRIDTDELLIYIMEHSQTLNLH